MADFTYTRALRNVGKKLVGWDTDDVRIILVMSNTTADTDEDAAAISPGITTLDEFDGTGYPTTFATRTALASEVVIENTSLDRAEWDAADVVWSSPGLGAGTRQAAGIVVYDHNTADPDSVPWLFWDSGGFPFTANGSNVTVQWNPVGVALVTNA